MKKLATLVTALLFSTAIGATGCKNDKNKTTDEVTPSAKTTDQPTTAPTPTPPPATTTTTPPPTSATPPTPSGATTQSATNDTGIAECDEYARTFDRYLACDKVPQQAKDASKANIEQMRQSWSGLKDPNVPPATKTAAADACKQATATLQQSAKALGCAL
ncbi:MAG TPA: hypothetical protein VL463_10250 [Kofleriaceae bacterium]|nr:hypothetical protein [Kofleriaceae bacterium]